MPKNGSGNRAYPDKTRARRDLSDRQRIVKLEEDQTLTEIMIDDVVSEMKRIRSCMAKKIKKTKQPDVDSESAKEPAKIG